VAVDEKALANVSTKLTLYVADQCPHCPLVAKKLGALAAAGAGIELEVLDVDAAAEAARAARVQAVPTLFVAGGLRLTGTVEVDDVAQLLVDFRVLAAPALGRFIEQGNADALADLMDREGALIPSLVELLATPTFSIRLGAMAVAEKLSARNPTVAAELADPLWARFADADDAVRGDLLYLVGEVGGRHLLPQIQAVARGDYVDDVKEAAGEAIEALGASDPG
jgi:hypothetical protein